MEQEKKISPDYSFVYNPVHISIYDNLNVSPQVITIDPQDTSNFIEELSQVVYREAKNLGGNIPYTVIRELSENFIHAHFKEALVSILDNGNTLRFTDQGPGIINKEAALEPGYSSACSEMRDYIRGVGSGLAIVNEFLKVSNGSISIEDNLNEGSVITVTLQTNKGNNQPLSKISPQKEISRLDGEKPKLTAIQKQLIRNIDIMGELGVSELKGLTAMAQSTICTNLQKLEDLGILEKDEISSKRSLTNYGAQFV